MSEIRIRIVVLWYVATYLTTRCLGEFPELHSHCASLKTETSFCMQTIDTIYQTMSQYEIYIRVYHKTYRLENFEDNFEKKDGLARGLIAFVSCVCVVGLAIRLQDFSKNGLILSNSVFDNKYPKILASHQTLQEIDTVVFELLRNKCSHYPLRQNLRKTIVIGDLITLRELVAQERSLSVFVLGIGGLYLCLRGSAVASKELWALRG
ncbi:hypothetical protein ALC60_05856 [Trachymyrmex zeteki]|uniref:Uncharacterized protein n=1 Tax=Mycetomoellerius zeteki TaxID=64791 RepID=A0A151X4D6_9HYME|nr:hypothetical protein ALC60_05856 [Trachymyrmex zeteki]